MSPNPLNAYIEIAICRNFDGSDEVEPSFVTPPPQIETRL